MSAPIIGEELGILQHFTADQLRGIAAFLEPLSRYPNVPETLYSGICGNLHNYIRKAMPDSRFIKTGLRAADKLVCETALSWAYHSKAYAYPVPDPRYSHDAWAALHRYDSALDKWSPGSEYAGLRRELCAHIVGRIGRYINSLETTA